MDPHDHSQLSEDEYSHLDDKEFARMIDKSIGLGEPTEVEQRVMSESLSYRHPTDSAAVRQVSQAIYSILLPQKINEVKDEEIFQNFRPPAIGADDPLLTAPAKSNGPFPASGSQPGFRKSASVGRGFPEPRDGAAASVVVGQEGEFLIEGALRNAFNARIYTLVTVLFAVEGDIDKGDLTLAVYVDTYRIQASQAMHAG
ncbi:hypothetical protein FRC12_024385 [Ceratobasidium sp. 428]|nr:hypothetical protein FRC12_024385 [Ceratobasidium sp. 428]